MLNDWYWEKLDDSEYRLKNTSDEMVAYLVHNYNDKWSCRIDNNDWNINFVVTFGGLRNAEEAIRQATLWIYNTCNQVADSFHHIRDHLPSLGELRKRAEDKNG